MTACKFERAKQKAGESLVVQSWPPLVAGEIQLSDGPRDRTALLQRDGGVRESNPELIERHAGTRHQRNVHVRRAEFTANQVGKDERTAVLRSVIFLRRITESRRRDACASRLPGGLLPCRPLFGSLLRARRRRARAAIVSGRASDH